MSFTAGTFLIVDHDAASVEIACQWQQCMQGQIALDRTDCGQEDLKRADAITASDRDWKREANFEIGPWQEISPWNPGRRRKESGQREKSAATAGSLDENQISSWKKHFW